MASVAELKRDKRLPDDEVDDVIELAARMQEEARRKESGASVDEVKSLGKELDIDPHFVDLALEKMRADRAAAAEAATRKRAARRKLMLAGGAVLGVLSLLAGAGAGKVRRAAAAADQAGSALAAVVDRQASLLPQLLAGAGGSVADIEPARRQLAEARELEARVAAADALQIAMAGAIARLPAPRTPAETQMRLSLQHELVGAQNRITAERRRYEEARAAWRAAGQRLPARLAITFGLAPRPR